MLYGIRDYLSLETEVRLKTRDIKEKKVESWQLKG